MGERAGEGELGGVERGETALCEGRINRNEKKKRKQSKELHREHYKQQWPMQKCKQQNSCKIAQHVKTILTMIYWLVASCLTKMIYKV